MVPLPVAGEQGCSGEPAGQEVLSGYCFRVPSATQQSVTVNPLDGSVHVVFQDNRNGGQDWDASKPGATLSDIDIFTTASSDGGRTWSAAVRVNQDPLGDHRDQFFPWSAYGPDGTLYVAYLDRALDPGGGPPGASFQLPNPGGRLIGRSLAVSHDGGASFTARAVSTGLFDGNLGFRKGGFLGDYTGIAAGPLGAFTAWPDTRRAGTLVKGDNPTDMWSDIVGYATAPGRADPRPRPARSAPPVAVQGHATVQPGTAPEQPGAYGPPPAATVAATAPPETRMGDILGGFLAGMLVMAASSVGARRRRRRRR